VAEPATPHKRCILIFHANYEACCIEISTSQLWPPTVTRTFTPDIPCGIFVAVKVVVSALYCNHPGNELPSGNVTVFAAEDERSGRKELKLLS
jgi:hypothetical protein